MKEYGIHHHAAGHDHEHHDHADHHHDHGKVSAQQHLSFAFFVAIILNSLLAILQVVYAYLAHSTSLLADAGHNLSDVLALIFSFVATLLVHKNANQKYSYGYKKSTILATLTNAVLLVITCTIILMEAIHHLIYHHVVTPLPVIAVAGFGILINGFNALMLHKGSQHDLNIKSAFLHMWYDALISFGVVLTGVAIYFTHLNILDPIVGILLTLFILKNSWALFRETLNLSLDGVPKAIDFNAVLDFLNKLPGVTRVHDLHIWALSTSSTALTVHLVRPQGLLNADERKQLSLALQQRFHIDHTTIQIETHEEPDCEHEQNCS